MACYKSWILKIRTIKVEYCHWEIPEYLYRIHTSKTNDFSACHIDLFIKIRIIYNIILSLFDALLYLNLSVGS
jgi:hypothetical protein